MSGFTQESMRFKINGIGCDDDNSTLDEFEEGGKLTIEVSGQREFGEFNEDAPKMVYLTEEEYDAMPGTVRAMKRRLGIRVKGDPSPEPTTEAVAPEGISSGNRCEVTLADGSHHRGTVRFVGIPNGMHSYMVGVELDEPFGKNDGVAKGTRYFECEPNYGVFVKPAKVTVGDFPPLTYDDDDEM